MKTMKNNTLLLFIAFLLSFSANAQTAHQVLSAAGGDAYNTSGSIALSVGQVVYTSSSNSTGSISQGVQQAKKIDYIPYSKS